MLQGYDVSEVWNAVRCSTVCAGDDSTLALEEHTMVRNWIPSLRYTRCSKNKSKNRRQGNKPKVPFAVSLYTARHTPGPADSGPQASTLGASKWNTRQSVWNAVSTAQSNRLYKPHRLPGNQPSHCLQAWEIRFHLKASVRALSLLLAFGSRRQT